MKKSGNNQAVSVIVTVLNEVESVELLLDALRAQTLPPKEVIVVDGGSSDGTSNKLEQYIKKYQHFPLTIFKKKGNRSIGRNHAIRKAETELIAITDAGCVPESDWLEQLVQKKQETGATIIAGYYRGAPTTPFEEAVVPYTLVMPDRVNPDEFLPATRSMLITKKAWEKVGGFNKKLSDNEDYAFAHSLKKAGIGIAFARRAIVAWKPRSTLTSFYWMIYRFAVGDIYAQLIRPKVLLIFLRYLVAIGLLAVGITEPLFLPFLLITFFGYAAWAVAKNVGYTPNGWQWLPMLQITSDMAVMHGSIVGLVQRLGGK